MILRRLTLAAILLFSLTALAQRTRLSPSRVIGISPQQDVELGREVAQDAEKQLVLIKSPDANAYITALGQRLLAKTPNPEKFPFTFKIVDDRSINAFALPGGPVYMHRGAIEAADNEAQLAGVLGHEIGHVVLRHGTSQVSKAQMTQTGFGILGAIFGNSTAGQLATQVGGFAANMTLLRYSRDAETQSDLLGTQILYDSGYDPAAMAQFFEKLAKEHKGSRTEQFFSNHPIPENRVVKVNDEIRRIGPRLQSPRRDSTDFQRIKRAMLALPAPAASKAAGSSAGKPAAPPAPPSTRTVALQISGIQLRHPDNWKPQVEGTNITLAPEGGIVGQGNLTYGMILDVFKPQNAKTLDAATTQFLEGLRKNNPDMKIVRQRVQTRMDGRVAQLTEATNTSAAGGQETNIILTVLRPDGSLQYAVEVAPTGELSKYRAAFQSVVDSIRLR